MVGRRLSSTASALRRSPTVHGGPTPHGGWVPPERWAGLNFPRVSKSASPIPYTFDTLVTGMPPHSVGWGGEPPLPRGAVCPSLTTTTNGYVVVNDYHYCCGTLTGPQISANIGAPAVSREDALKSTRKIFLNNITKSAPLLRLRLYSDDEIYQNNHQYVNTPLSIGLIVFIKSQMFLSHSYLLYLHSHFSDRLVC